MILGTAFLPPATYFTPLIGVNQATIDVNRRFVKQNIRTRCFILSSNGLMRLVVPVISKGRNLMPDSDIRISYAEPWQRTHLRSIEAAYGRSPFYIHYIDALEEVIMKKHDFLIELNHELMVLVNAWIGLNLEITRTEKNQKATLEPGDESDYAEFTDGSEPQHFLTGLSYPQVFSDRFGFVDGLSILDLVMNMGPG